MPLVALPKGMFRKQIARLCQARAASSAAKTGSIASYDVAIVGAGPAGLLLACGLASSPGTKNLSVAVIEGGSLKPAHNFAKSPPDHYTNRVSLLTPHTILYLEKIGVWHHIKHTRIEPFDEIVAYDGLLESRVEFGESEMALMCENVNLQAALLLRLKEVRPSTAVLEDCRVENISTGSDPSSWPVVELSNGDRIRSRLLVGADGFNSPVRKYAGIVSRGWAYDRFGVVATLEHKYEDFRSTAWQRFLPTGPLALLPLPGKNCTMVWLTTPELSKLLVTLPEDVFIPLLNAAFVLPQADLEYYYGLLKKQEYQEFKDDIAWRMLDYALRVDIDQYPLEIATVLEGSRARFPLKLLHADCYVADRVALVGDAAHTTHPLAGQGLNMGQGDVESLVAALETALSRGLDIGSPLALEPYWAERYPQNHVLLGVVDKIHKLFSIDWFPVVQARSFGLDMVNNLPFVKDFFMGRMK